MTTTTTRYRAEIDAGNDVHGAARDINHSHDANRSKTLLLMNEALARVRMRLARKAEKSSAQRPAREVAMAAAKRRERF